MPENRDSQTDSALDAVTIRRAGAEDEEALRRLADLDSTRVPDGPVLMAEINGQPVAAISVLSGESFAHPFVPTQELRRLLEVRASQVHLPPHEGARRGGVAKPGHHGAERTRP